MNATVHVPHLDGYQGREPSKHILDTLRRYGVTERGFPVYRLVDSSLVLEMLGGLWNDWDANLNEQDRGGMVFINEDVEGKRETLRPVSFRPDRIIAEVREVPKYSHIDEQGWVLERWYPAAYYGTPELYEALKIPGTNVTRFGPFPHSGQYELAAGVFEQEPSLSFLQDFIAGWEAHKATYPENIVRHIREREHRARLADEERSRKGRRENEYRLKHSVDSISSSTNLEGGRWRQHAMRRSGLHAHVGN